MVGNDDIVLGIDLNDGNVSKDIKDVSRQMQSLVEDAKQFSTLMGESLKAMRGVKQLSGAISTYSKGDTQTQITKATTGRSIAEQEASSALLQDSKILLNFLSQLSSILKADQGLASLSRGRTGIGAPADTSTGIKQQIADNQRALAFQLDAQRRLKDAGVSHQDLEKQSQLISEIRTKEQQLNEALVETVQAEKDQVKYGTQVLAISERIKIVEAEIVAARIEGLGAETEFALQRERQELLVKKTLAESNGQFTAAVEEQIQGMAVLQKAEQQRLATLKQQAEQAKQEATARKEATAALQNQMQQQMKTIGQPTQAFLDQRKQEETIRRNVLAIDKEIALVEAEINAKKGGTDAAELRKLELKKQQLVLDRELVSSERQVTAEVQKQIGVIAGLEAENTRLSQQERANSGLLNRRSPGALFAIQADLLANYFIMNQIFKLFSFGAQYVTELDKNFRDLQATIAATDTEMVDLKKTVIDASTGTRFSAVEVAKATVTLGQAGLSIDQIKKTIRPIIEFATATGSDLTQSLDTATSAMNVFSIQADEMPHIIDVMTAAINDSKLNTEKLATGIQYAGNVAAQSGVQFEEFISVLGAAANSGVKSGSTIGTGLRQVLTAFIEPSKKMENALIRLNIPMAALDIQSNGLIGVFKNLKAAGFSTADAFKTMDLRAAAMFAAISHNLDAAEKLQQAFLLTEAATQANQTQMKSLSNTTDRFTNDLGILIENGIGPLRDILQGLLANLSTFLEKLAETPQVVGAIIAGLTTFVGILVTVRTTMAAISGIGTLFGLGAGAATFFSGGTFVLAAAAIIAVATGLKLMQTNADDAAPSLDKLTAAAKGASGAYTETTGKIESLDASIKELGDRYPTLANNQEAVRTEALKLQNKFGELGLTFDSSKVSVESLKDALRALRNELQQLASSQATDALQKQLELVDEIKNQMVKTQGLSFNVPNQQTNLEYLTNQSGSLPGTAPAAFFKSVPGLQALNDLVNQFVTPLENEAKASDPSIKEQRQKIQDSVLQLRQKAHDVMEQIRKDIDAVNTKMGDNETVNGVTKEQAKGYLEQGLQQLQEKMSQLLNVTAAFSQVDVLGIQQEYAAAKADFLNNFMQDAVEDSSQRMKQIQLELSQGTDENGNKLTPEQKKLLSDEMDQLRTSLISLATSSLSDMFDSEALKASLSTPGATRAFGEVQTTASQNLSEYQAHLDAQLDLNKIKFDQINEKQQQYLQKAEELYQHATDATDQKIKHFDYLIKESQDTVRGSLRGIFGDADIELFKDQQKKLQDQRLVEQQAALKTYIGQYDSSIGAIGGAVASLKTPTDGDPGKISNYISAQKGLLDLEEKRRQLETQLVDVNDQLAISQQNVTETGMTMGQAFQYAIEHEVEASAQASDLRLNMVKIVHDLTGNFTSAFGTFFSDVLTGTKSVSEGFKAMAGSMLQSLAKVVNDALAQQFWQLLVGGFKSSGAGGFLSGLFGANSGGLVPSRYMATGGANPNRDSVNARLRPGEFVMRKSAVDMIGVDNLRAMNAMGNNVVSRSTGTMQMPEQRKIESNIYLLAPDQKPSLGPNDVKYIIGQDILTGGATKSLIKQVVAGA